ncbi:hypothetical protein HOY80DRAFT_1071206 [Tuber brumale]|nr:hypothetical protein HOY80DRAFT_1071206 [Tuber brumale]
MESKSTNPGSRNKKQPPFIFSVHALESGESYTGHTQPARQLLLAPTAPRQYTGNSPAKPEKPTLNPVFACTSACIPGFNHFSQEMPNHVMAQTPDPHHLVALMTVTVPYATQLFAVRRPGSKMRLVESSTASRLIVLHSLHLTRLLEYAPPNHTSTMLSLWLCNYAHAKEKFAQPLPGGMKFMTRFRQESQAEPAQPETLPNS